METLYDLLGALPRDDAEELRAAFRSAVKGVHPDLNPGDPLAAQKFREIVRANEILSDEDQRAVYDHLLVLAQKEQKQQTTAKTMHKAATSVIALVMAAGACFGSYLVYRDLAAVSDSLKHFADSVIASPADFAGLAPTPAQARVQEAAAPEAGTEAGTTEAAPPEVLADEKAQPAPVEARAHTASIGPPPDESAQNSPATVGIAPEAIVPAGSAPQAESGNAPRLPVGRPVEIVAGDAKAFRERGVMAYRSGDLYGAIAAFDRAIQIDPKFSGAYVDRGIVLYRLRQFERAFADIAHAKRIERSKRSKAAQADGKRRSPQAAAALGLPPFFHRRTAKLD